MPASAIDFRIKNVLLLIFILFIVYFFMYPLYVRYMCGKYAIKFANIIGSHDINKYNDFFSENTEFMIGEKEISYHEFSRQLISKSKDFSSEYSYGHLEEDSRVHFKRNFSVSLMLPIEINGANNSLSGIVEGTFILKSQWLFFFKIKQVELEDKEALWSMLLENVYDEY